MADNPRIKIVADHREQASGIVRMLGADPDIDLEIATLSVGDYQIGHNTEGELTVVERKSADDFCASILDRRMFSQSVLIKESGARAIYLIEGDIFSTGRNIHPNALMGAMSYLAAIEGYPVIPVNSIDQTVMMLKTLARHNQHGLGYTPSLRPATPKTLHERQQWLVGGLPGLGEARVNALLAHFQTPAAVLSATAKELTQADGIGLKTAQTIREVLDTPCP